MTQLSVGERAEKLALEMRRRRVRRTVTLAVLVSLIAASAYPSYALLRWVSGMEARADYLSTWCETFGDDEWVPSDLEKWKVFIDRHRPFLNDEMTVLAGPTGAQTVFESYLINYQTEWRGSENFAAFEEEMRKIVPLWFKDLNRLLASDSQATAISFPSCG